LFLDVNIDVKSNKEHAFCPTTGSILKRDAKVRKICGNLLWVNAI
jgi:hypothetical protein